MAIKCLTLNKSDFLGNKTSGFTSEEFFRKHYQVFGRTKLSSSVKFFVKELTGFSQPGNIPSK